MIDDIFQADVPSLSSPFLDTEGHAYEQDIAYANFQGIIAGDTDARGDLTWYFRPNDNLNRAEAAKIISLQLGTVASASEGSEVVTINMMVSNFSFSPKTIRVKEGQFVTIKFNTTGAHTFTVQGLTINKLLFDAKEQLSFVAEKKGNYPFQCAVQGHKEKGMEGVIIIE